MLRFLLIRFGRAALTVALVVTFAFIVLRLSGDPALIIMSVDAPPEAIAAFKDALTRCREAEDRLAKVMVEGGWLQ